MTLTTYGASDYIEILNLEGAIAKGLENASGVATFENPDGSVSAEAVVNSKG